MTVTSMLMMGLLLGIRHAIDADHVAAVATLATRQSTVAGTVRQGIAWGIGHAAVLLLFGGVVLLLGSAVPQGLAQFLELGVGLMLIVLGVDVIRRLRRERVHFHAHRHHGGILHLHMHSHAGEPAHRHGGILQHTHHHHGHQESAVPSARRALLVGMMHGMAGSAALILLSLAAAPSLAAGLLYMVAFGLGSVLGMALMSAVIAVPLRATASLRSGARGWLTAAVGTGTCALGLVIVYRIGFASGLLTPAGL